MCTFPGAAAEVEGLERVHHLPAAHARLPAVVGGAVGRARPVAQAVGDDRVADVGGGLVQRHVLEQLARVVGQAHVGLLGMVALQRALDVARDEQREGVDDAAVLVQLGTVMPLGIDHVVAPELGGRGVHVQQHHAVAVVVGVARAAKVVDLARGHAVGVLLRRLVVVPPRRVADEEHLQHREAVDGVELRGHVLGQVLRQLDQRQARHREDQALRGERGGAALGADVERQRALAQARWPETQQGMAAGQRHVGMRAQHVHQAARQARRSARDRGQLLAHGLERAQPPDDPLGGVQVLRDHVIERAGVAQLDHRAMAQDALRRQRVPEARGPQRLAVQLRVLAQAHVVGLAEAVDPGLVVGRAAHHQHDPAAQQLQRVEALFLGREVVVGGDDALAAGPGEIHQRHVQLGAQLGEARLQRWLEAHRAHLGDEAVQVLRLDAAAPAVGRGFQDQDAVACVGELARAVQAGDAAAGDDDVVRVHAGAAARDGVRAAKAVIGEVHCPRCRPPRPIPWRAYLALEMLPSPPPLVATCLGSP